MTVTSSPAVNQERIVPLGLGVGVSCHSNDRWEGHLACKNLSLTSKGSLQKKVEE